MRDRPSPNHDERPVGQPVDLLILHYTGMRDAKAALDRLCDPAAKVSAHYLIEEDGAVWRLVPEARRAWHAGVSFWDGARDINARSIGIELVNPGHEFGYHPFPEPQMQALERLCHEILARYKAISPARVLGHSDVAPARKQDPGELFDWARLAAAGIGLFPRPDAAPCDWTAGQLQAALGAYGYDVAPSGTLDPATRDVLIAFQRHFRPQDCAGRADAESCGRLADLLRQAGRPTAFS